MTKVFSHHMSEDAVFSLEPHFAQPTTSLSFPDVIRNAGVVGTVDPETAVDPLSLDRQFRLFSSTEIRDYHDWMMRHRLGGLSFYMPTWNNDFQPVGGVSSGGSTITVRDNGFGIYHDRVASVRVDDARSPWKFTSFGLLVCTSDGGEYYFKMGSGSDATPASSGPAEPNAYVDNGNGTLTINLKVVAGDSSFSRDYSENEIRTTSLILSVRQQTPAVEYLAYTASKVGSRQIFTQVFYESPFEPPPPGSGYALRVDDQQGNDDYVVLQPNNRLLVDDGGTLVEVRLEPDSSPPTGQLQVDDNGIVNVSLTSI